MDARAVRSGPDPSRVLALADLARELSLLRSRAARGTHSARVSLDELAGRVREPKSTIHAYLVGKRLAPAEVLDRIVIALDATAAEQHEWAEAWFRVAACREAARQVSAARAVPDASVPRQLPLPVDGFTGREAELAELDHVHSSGQIAAISGTAGVGKTALALQWAHRRAPRFPDGQLYVDLRGYDPVRPMPTTEAVARFLRAFGVAAVRIPRELDERAASFRSLAAGRRMLLVLDNARDTEHVRELLPGTSTCAVLVTSRDSLTGLIARHGAHRLELDVLPIEDATQLLRALIAPHLPASRELAALAELCARLPLALRIAAEFAATRCAPPLHELVDELATGQHELDLLEAGHDPRTALRAVFSWSYCRLGAAEARMFRLVGLHADAEASTDVLAALAGASTADTRHNLGVLIRAHLLQEVRPGRFGMHNLLRSYARELAASVEGECGILDGCVSRHRPEPARPGSTCTARAARERYSS